MKPLREKGFAPMEHSSGGKDNIDNIEVHSK